MVSLTWPWGLLWLAVVAAGAAVALRRPLHRIVPVSSLRLWRRAVEAAGPAGARRPRRISAAWVLLLAGAVAAGLGLARPVWHRDRPVRQMTLAVYPSAELGDAGAEALAESVAALLDRLSPTDRVRLALPAILGGPTQPLAPQAAARRVRELGWLPVRAAELSVPTPDDSFGPVVRFAPAVLPLPEGPHAATIQLPAFPANVTVDAFGAEDAPDGLARVFVAVRNHTPRPRTETVVVTSDERAPTPRPVDLPPNARTGLNVQVPSGEVISVAVEGGTGPAAAAWAVRRVVSSRTVAMIGRDDPLLRRFIQVHPRLRLVGSAAEADMAVAVGTAPPADKPALVIDPPSAPPGWSEATPLADLSLADAAADPDSPLMARVDLSAVAVRAARAWRPTAPPAAPPALRVGPDALIVAAEQPRRVYVSFDLAAENTNFGLDKSFVIFLAEVVRYLTAAAPEMTARYESLSPLQAGPQPGWTRVSPGASRAGPLPWPGLYRDSAGGLHAVSLTGLRSARTDADPVAAARQLALPQPRRIAKGVELWPMLAVLAAVLWVAGWAVRLK
ncbi:MAG: hypothetical protein ACYS5V_16015 [Planctomycetota bacterium]|jgi:hypothetical protein